MSNSRPTRGPDELFFKNQEFLKRILDGVAANMQTRAASKAFGEVCIKLTYNKGELTGAKVIEETVVRPTDF